MDNSRKQKTYTIPQRNGGNRTTTKPNPKLRIAVAEGRVKPLTRLLRCATALRVTAPLGYGSRQLGSDERRDA